MAAEPLGIARALAQVKDAERADDGMARALRRLESADPVVDVTAVIARGDSRFLGIAGFTITVPGVLNVNGQPSDKENERLVTKHGVRVIEGTSDDDAVLALRAAGRLEGLASARWVQAT